MMGGSTQAVLKVKIVHEDYNITLPKSGIPDLKKDSCQKEHLCALVGPAYCKECCDPLNTL